MTDSLPFGQLVPCSALAGADPVDAELLEQHAAEARRYLLSFRWCNSVEECFFAFGVGGIFGIFLLRIVPDATADEWLWVVSGDIPPLYLSSQDFSDPTEVLRAYAAERWDWVFAIEAGEAPSDSVAPVNVAPTADAASQLRTRLEFIVRHFL